MSRYLWDTTLDRKAPREPCEAKRRTRKAMLLGFAFGAGVTLVVRLLVAMNRGEAFEGFGEVFAFAYLFLGLPSVALAAIFGQRLNIAHLTPLIVVFITVTNGAIFAIVAGCYNWLLSVLARKLNDKP